MTRDVNKTILKFYKYGFHKMNKDANNKFSKSKQNSMLSTNPGTSRPRNRRPTTVKHTPEPLCPLLAKDSGWVDIIKTDVIEPGNTKVTTYLHKDEEVMQFVDCDNDPQAKPLAIMFPRLLNEDPQTLQEILNRAMSTTEVTRHLVDIGQKANFTFLKRADRLIPPDKQWMETLTEKSNSHCSLTSGILLNCLSKEYDAESEATVDLPERKVKKRKFNTSNIHQSSKQSRS